MQKDQIFWHQGNNTGAIVLSIKKYVIMLSYMETYSFLTTKLLKLPPCNHLFYFVRRVETGKYD